MMTQHTHAHGTAARLRVSEGCPGGTSPGAARPQMVVLLLLLRCPVSALSCPGPPLRRASPRLRRSALSPRPASAAAAAAGGGGPVALLTGGGPVVGGGWVELRARRARPQRAGGGEHGEAAKRSSTSRARPRPSGGAERGPPPTSTPAHPCGRGPGPLSGSSRLVPTWWLGSLPSLAKLGHAAQAEQAAAPTPLMLADLARPGLSSSGGGGSTLLPEQRQQRRPDGPLLSQQTARPCKAAAQLQPAAGIAHRARGGKKCTGQGAVAPDILGPWHRLAAAHAADALWRDADGPAGRRGRIRSARRDIRAAAPLRRAPRQAVRLPGPRPGGETSFASTPCFPQCDFKAAMPVDDEAVVAAL